MSPKKFLIFIILFAGALGGGYYYGFQKGARAEKKLELLQNELERAQFKLKILVEVRQKLNRAQTEIAQKNFGNAQKEVETVQAILKALQTKAEPTVKKKLEALMPSLQEIIKGLSAMDFSMVSKIEEFKTSLEKIAIS